MISVGLATPSLTATKHRPLLFTPSTSSVRFRAPDSDVFYHFFLPPPQQCQREADLSSTVKSSRGTNWVTLCQLHLLTCQVLIACRFVNCGHGFDTQEGIAFCRVRPTERAHIQHGVRNPSWRWGPLLFGPVYVRRIFFTLSSKIQNTPAPPRNISAVTS